VLAPFYQLAAMVEKLLGQLFIGGVGFDFPVFRASVDLQLHSPIGRFGNLIDNPNPSVVGNELITLFE
jgi:hypothetical protein